MANALITRLGRAVLALALSTGTAVVRAQETPSTPPSVLPVDYGRAENWLCRPGQPGDACGRSRQDSTILQADGSRRVEAFRADPRAPVDCFYVYPTVSTDPTPNASLRAEKEEQIVVDQQFARFASVCRPFAPLYRQVTLTALRAGLHGQAVKADRDLPYADVKAAWDYYLTHDNHGRGVVLIGHSQGSLVLAQLVKKEIDGKPVQRRLLSVILAGYRLQVPVGRDVGGDFAHVPLCRSAGQIGCAINFASFRADSPPPPDERLFGISAGPDLQAACVNPAALSGGSAPLHAYLGAGAGSVVADGVPPGPWTRSGGPITTAFVEVPGLLSAECRDDGRHNYLAITLHPRPGAERTNVITGDVVIDGRVRPEWGLHIVDLNLTMGNLLDVVRAEAKTYRAANP